MSSFFSDYFLNSSIIDVLQLYWTSINVYLSETVTALRETKSETIVSAFEQLPSSLYFDDFQWALLKIFSTFLAINLLLIVLVWKIYGTRICDRFMKLSTLKEIEELKASVSKLKLPKEHTPRI